MVMVMIVMIMIMVMMHRRGDDIYDYSDNDVQNVDFISDSDGDVDEWILCWCLHEADAQVVQALIMMMMKMMKIPVTDW